MMVEVVVEREEVVVGHKYEKRDLEQVERSESKKKMMLRRCVWKENKQTQIKSTNQ